MGKVSCSRMFCQANALGLQMRPALTGWDVCPAGKPLHDQGAPDHLVRGALLDPGKDYEADV